MTEDEAINSSLEPFCACPLCGVGCFVINVDYNTWGYCADCFVRWFLSPNLLRSDEDVLEEIDSPRAERATFLDKFRALGPVEDEIRELERLYIREPL
jgi:hypothetical protein